MHCGFMDRSEWEPGMKGVPPLGPGPHADVCPGWLVRLPMVEDGARAYAARRDGILHLYDPDGLAIVYELAEIAARSFAIYENERLEEMKRQQGRING
jgi:hypothetical protein